VFNKFKMIWKVTVVAYFKILTFLKEIRPNKMSQHKENYLQESICRKLHTDNPHTLCATVQNPITQHLSLCTSAYTILV